MCFHKSLALKMAEQAEHYNAAFESITEEIEYIKERFTILLNKDELLSAKALTEAEAISTQLMAYSQKDSLPSVYSKQELSEMKWCLKTLVSFKGDTFERYHENGFDYLPQPIITAGEPSKFKMFRWGLIPFYMTDKEKAMTLRTQTMNCISEEMYDKPSFRDAVKNGQRCLIPVTGFFEWRWLDEQGTVKIPYYITFRDQKVRSMAGLYSRWKDKETDRYYYSYTVLTTKANMIMDYVHNNKKRMPVFISKENEKAWLNRELKKDDVLDLCQPFQDNAMRAYTVSKLLTAKNMNTNVADVLQPMNYQAAITEANQFLKTGNKKLALEAFKSSLGDEKLRIEQLENAARQEILTELSL